jgi:hypothetical protein
MKVYSSARSNHRALDRAPRVRRVLLPRIPVMRVKGHQGWPFGVRAPAPDDCAANDVAPGAGAVFAKPVLK